MQFFSSCCVLVVVLECVGCHGVQQPTTRQHCSSSRETCGGDNEGLSKVVHRLQSHMQAHSG